MTRSVAFMVAALALGCAEEPLTTIDAKCGYGELSFEHASPSSWPRDVIIVVDPELALRIELRLRSLVRGLVTGQIDAAHPERRLIRMGDVRIAVASVNEATRLLDAVEVTPTTLSDGSEGAGELALPPFGWVERFHYAPHGYEDDADAFVDRVLACAKAPASCAAEPDREAPFALFAELILVSDRDACRASEPADDCDASLTAFVSAWHNSGVGPGAATGRWYPTLLVGVPEDLVALTDYYAYWGEDGAAERVLGDPRMHAAGGVDACAGRRDITAQPTPVLLEQLADSDTPIGSVCAADFRPALGAIEYCCQHCSSEDVPFSHDARLTLNDDGTYACQLRELLPAEGPVTRCEQLSAYGRESLPIAIEDGRQVCALVQRRETEASEHYGWYVPTQWASYSEWPSDSEVDRPLCAESRGVLPHWPALTPSTHYVPGSTIRYRCFSENDGPQLRSCSTFGDDGS